MLKCELASVKQTILNLKMHYCIFRTISCIFFLATAAGRLILWCDLYADKFINMPLNLCRKLLDD